jgi:hypothetical protein
MSSGERCDACRFWDPPKHGNSLTGICRRHPPAYTSVRKDIWPHTHSDDWCGELVPRPSPKETGGG